VLSWITCNVRPIGCPYVCPGRPDNLLDKHQMVGCLSMGKCHIERLAEKLYFIGLSGYGKPKRKQLQDIKLLHESDFFISGLYFITRNIFFPDFFQKNVLSETFYHIRKNFKNNFLLSHQEKCVITSEFLFTFQEGITMCYFQINMSGFFSFSENIFHIRST
jgi:hypothetical protein